MLAYGTPAMRVLITRALGSTPREAGSAMLVTGDEAVGTIGGGRLEWEAIERARTLLRTGGDRFDLEMPLGPALGQCCGGHVSLRIERADLRVLDELDASERAQAASLPVVLLFGAGHVGQALACALVPLPLRVRWIDGRPGAFGRGAPIGVEPVSTEAWEREVAHAPPGAACLVLTHSHALDARIASAALERGEFAYVGLIGSVSKRRRFERAFRASGLAEALIAPLVCPIGNRGVRDKRPAVIAALAAAEIIEALDRHRLAPHVSGEERVA